MTADERELIAFYRSLNEGGRGDVLAIARAYALREEFERADAERAALRVVDGGRMSVNAG